MTVLSSSIDAHQKGIHTIQNNIANHSTNSYKKHTSITKGGPSEHSAGVVHVGRRDISSQGITSVTNHPTDFLIEGEAMCVVEEHPETTDPNRVFTRSTSFRSNQKGMLVNQSGLTLMGWRLGENDNLPQDCMTMNSLVPINIGNISSSAKSTSEISIGMNLDANQQIIGNYNPEDNTHNLSAASNIPSIYQKSITAFDSLGESHNLLLSFGKKEIVDDPTTNRPTTIWAVEINAARVHSGGYDIKNPGIDRQITYGELTFNGEGTLVNISDNLKQPFQIAWNNGADENSITLNWGEVGSEYGNFQQGITQRASAFSTRSVEQNGYTSGYIKSINIDQEGYINAYMSNGTFKKIYQIPVVTFPNIDGLNDVGSNSYQVSSESGAANLETANAAHVSFITHALEQPNCDPSALLTELIYQSQMLSLVLRAQAKEFEQSSALLHELRV